MFRESPEEFVLKCESLLHEQKLAGKSFDEAFGHVCNVHGAKTLTEEEARESWMNNETDESTIDEEHNECCACECDQFGFVISNIYEHGADKCMTDDDRHKMATRVIDGRYIFCRGRPGKAIILIDLFHKKMMT